MTTWANERPSKPFVSFAHLCGNGSWGSWPSRLIYLDHRDPISPSRQARDALNLPYRPGCCIDRYRRRATRTAERPMPAPHQYRNLSKHTDTRQALQQSCTRPMLLSSVALVLALFYPCGGICKAAEGLQAFLVLANPVLSQQSTHDALLPSSPSRGRGLLVPVSVLLSSAEQILRPCRARLG